MMVSITNEAAGKIKAELSGAPNSVARIILVKAGCAGSMLRLVLERANAGDTVIEVSGIPLHISGEATPFFCDVSIYVEQGLGGDVIVKNNSAKKTCKCGKSFKE